MDPLFGTQLTDAMMADPWSFDPNQKTNQFSPYPNQAIPYPMTYNEGLAGGPVNAATGQPIASYQAWKQANPAGVTLNATPAQPQATPGNVQNWQYQNALLNSMAQANPQSAISNIPGLRNQANQLYGGPYYNQAAYQAIKGNPNITAEQLGQVTPNWVQGTPYQASLGGQGPGATGTPAAAPQGGGAAPNNWMAAMNALANPGNPITQGANVPMQTGSQPAGGVNQSFLSQAGPGMNQNFLSALRAIQGRPQS